jgi:hypothetical protein
VSFVSGEVPLSVADMPVLKRLSLHNNKDIKIPASVLAVEDMQVTT